MNHIPVMLLEVIRFLNVKSCGIYIDATFGMGGHTKEILKRLRSKGVIFLFDKDSKSIDIANKLYYDDCRVFIYRRSFDDMKNALYNNGIFSGVDGILVDLGISFLQIGDISRGFSFNSQGILDMRMDINQKTDAFKFINNFSLCFIKKVLRKNCDEKFLHSFLKKLDNVRKRRKIILVTDLLEIIYSVKPKVFRDTYSHPATKLFQAIRMYVNKELVLLEKFLYEAFFLLKVGGCVILISFNFLEDKVIKDFIRKNSKSAISCSNNCNFFVEEVCKIVRPNISEININMGARSAIMRVLRKLS